MAKEMATNMVDNVQHPYQKRPPRVMMVIPGSSEDQGSMVFVRRQTDSIERLGIEVHRFFLSSRTDPIMLAQEFLRFRRAVVLFQPDLIHAQFGTMTAFFCAISNRIPLVITFRGSDLNPSPNVSWLRNASGRLLSQISTLRATKVMCVSNQLVYRLWIPFVRHRAEIVPAGVDTEIFFPIPQVQARKVLGWSMEERIVLFNQGRGSKVKRLDLAQAAIHVAQSLCPNVRLVVLDGHVQPETIPLYMNAADCLLVTSDYEGSPNIVKESLACNLPIVSVRVGDVSERLKDVHPSCIVVRDIEEIGRSVAEMVLHPCRSNGREIVQRDLSDTLITKRIMSVYLQVLQHSKYHSQVRNT